MGYKINAPVVLSINDVVADGYGNIDLSSSTFSGTVTAIQYRLSAQQLTHG